MKIIIGIENYEIRTRKIVMYELENGGEELQNEGTRWKNYVSDCGWERCKDAEEIQNKWGKGKETEGNGRKLWRTHRYD